MGTKIDGRSYMRHERDNLARTLDHAGEYRLARHVQRGDCLNDRDLHRVESVLATRGVLKHFDYHATTCRCWSDQ